MFVHEEDDAKLCRRGKKMQSYAAEEKKYPTNNFNSFFLTKVISKKKVKIKKFGLCVLFCFEVITHKI